MMVNVVKGGNVRNVVNCSEEFVRDMPDVTNNSEECRR
jgi:hypothetical protein